MNDLMIFEGHEVEAFEFEGQVIFNPYHVGACLEIGENGVKSAVSKMNDKQVVKLTNSKVALSQKVVSISWYSRAISQTLKNLQIGLPMKCFLHYARQDIMRCRNREQPRKRIQRVYQQ